MVFDAGAGGYGATMRRRLPIGVALAAAFLIAPWAPFRVSAQSVPCREPLTENQVAGLAKAGVPEARLRQLVTACGAGFVTTPAVRERLEKAGLSRKVVDLIAASVRGAAAEAELRMRAELAL